MIEDHVRESRKAIKETEAFLRRLRESARLTDQVLLRATVTHADTVELLKQCEETRVWSRHARARLRCLREHTLVTTDRIAQRRKESS